MADWLKINHRLIRSQKVWALADALKVAFPHALGVALIWLTWVDEQTEEGQTGMTVKNMDAELRQRGAVSALVSIGWAGVDECGLVYAVDFSKHCGATAKTRAEAARKKALQRIAGKGRKKGTSVHENMDMCPQKKGTSVQINEGPEENNIPKGILYSASCATADAAQHGTIEQEALTEEELAAQEAEAEAEWQAMRQALRTPNA